MNAKHTQGPWKIQKSGIPGSKLHVIYAYHPTDWTRTVNVAETWTESDARLIAAAPETAAERDRLKEINAELLAALNDCEELLAFLESEIVGGYSSDGALARARATIAKATK